MALESTKNTRLAYVWLDGYNMHIPTPTPFGDKECHSGTPHYHLDPIPIKGDCPLILDCCTAGPGGEPISNGDGSKGSTFFITR